MLREQNVLYCDGLLKIALAESEARAGDPDRAVALIDEALATAERDPANSAPAEGSLSALQQDFASLPMQFRFERAIAGAAPCDPPIARSARLARFCDHERHAAAARRRLNMFLNVMTPLIMVISFSDSMQLKFAARDRLIAGEDRYAAFRDAVWIVGPPCAERSSHHKGDGYADRQYACRILLGASPACRTGVKLQFGDHITCVGEDRLRQVEAIVGNQTSALQHSQIIPIFVGIALGVPLGSIPVFIPGVPAPLSLGLAGGPVVVAIVLARIGTIGPLHWNMPPDTIDTVRERGVSLFMACVGIYAGKSLVATLLNGHGLLWMGCAALITFIPICLVGLVARGIVKVNCLSLCGVLAGNATAAGPGLCQRAQSVEGAIHRICSRLPADHVPAHRVAAIHPRFSLACLLNCINEIGFQVLGKIKQKSSIANERLVQVFGITIGPFDWPRSIPKPNRS